MARVPAKSGEIPALSRNGRTRIASGESGRLTRVLDVTLGGRVHGRLPVVLVFCFTLLLVSLVLGIGAGSVRLSPDDVVAVLFDRLTGRPPGTPDAVTADAIVWRIRLPRVLLAAVVGAALSCAGVVVQTLVRNALADPYLLGVSSGASVGATAVLLFGALSTLGIWALATGGVAGAAAAMVLVFAVAQRGGRLVPLNLLLCGVALAAMFSAVACYLALRR